MFILKKWIGWKLNHILTGFDLVMREWEPKFVWTKLTNWLISIQLLESILYDSEDTK